MVLSEDVEVLVDDIHFMLVRAKERNENFTRFQLSLQSGGDLEKADQQTLALAFKEYVSLLYEVLDHIIYASWVLNCNQGVAVYCRTTNFPCNWAAQVRQPPKSSNDPEDDFVKNLLENWVAKFMGQACTVEQREQVKGLLGSLLTRILTDKSGKAIQGSPPQYACNDAKSYALLYELRNGHLHRKYIRSIKAKGFINVCINDPKQQIFSIVAKVEEGWQSIPVDPGLWLTVAKWPGAQQLAASKKAAMDMKVFATKQVPRPLLLISNDLLGFVETLAHNLMNSCDLSR